LATEQVVAALDVGGAPAGGWSAGDPFLTGGPNYPNTSDPVSVAGVPNAAPADVYKTYVTTTAGMGPPRSLRLPAPNGPYPPPRPARPGARWPAGWGWTTGAAGRSRGPRRRRAPPRWSAFGRSRSPG